MIIGKCTEKYRNKNNYIYGYRLEDTHGNYKDVNPEQLKAAIRNKQIMVLNLTLTSDNRLVDTTPNKQPEDNIKAVVDGILLGLHNHSFIYTNDTSFVNINHYKYFYNEDVNNILSAQINKIDDAIKIIVSSGDYSALMHTVVKYGNYILGEIYDCNMNDLVEKHHLLAHYTNNKNINTSKIEVISHIYTDAIGTFKGKPKSINYEYNKQTNSDFIRIIIDNSTYLRKDKEYKKQIYTEIDNDNKIFIEKYNKDIDKTLNEYDEYQRKYGKKALVKEYLKHLKDYFPDGDDYIEDSGSIEFIAAFHESDYKLEYEPADTDHYVSKTTEIYGRPEDIHYIMTEPVKQYFQHLIDKIADNIMQGNWLEMYQWTDDDEVFTKTVPELIENFPTEIRSMQREVNCPYNIIAGLTDLMRNQYEDKIAMFNYNDCYSSELGQCPMTYIYTNHFKGLFTYISEYYDNFTDEDGYPLKVVPKERLLGSLYTYTKKGDDMIKIITTLPDGLIANAVKLVHRKEEYDKFINKCCLLGFNIKD